MWYTAFLMSSIHLFTGDNTYALLQERRLWISSFRQKHGEANLSFLDPKKISFTQLLDEIAVAPFIAENRLVVVDGVPKFEKEQVESLPDTMHPQVVLLFCDRKPDKRLSATKALLAIADVKTFSHLSRAQLLLWLSQCATEYGSELSRDTATILLDIVGDDQDLLASEIRKIATFAGKRPITKEDIDVLVLCTAEQAGWQLMDLIADKKPEKALAFARKLLERGESAHGLWNRVLWMMTQLTLVHAAYHEGMNHPGAITKATGVNFGAAKTLLPLARRISGDTLQSLITRFSTVDVALKTGGLKATAEAPAELEAMLDVCVYEMCTA